MMRFKFNKLVFGFGLLICVFFLKACSKNAQYNEVYFYTSNADFENFKFLLGDNDTFVLPFVNQALTCENDSLKALTSFKLIKSGIHEIRIFDLNNNQVVQGEFTLRRSLTKLNMSNGKASINRTGDCVVFAVY